MPTTTNAQVLIAERITSQHAASTSGETVDEYFEYFSAEQILKRYDLSSDEIRAGLVGGGGDGGVDGMYTLVNGVVVLEEPETSGNPVQNPRIELHVVQAKHTRSFQESPIEKLIATCGEVFDLTKDYEDFTGNYSADLVDAVRVFRSTYRELAQGPHELAVKVWYTTVAAQVSQGVLGRLEQLRGTLAGHFERAEMSCKALGATELWTEANSTASMRLNLALSDNPISTELHGEVGYVCLVKLHEFLEFLTEDDGKTIRRTIFEANVRDYQGGVQVNNGIAESLRHADAEDFWWLNNGISIVASHATLQGRTLYAENPQIVNGLQTSAVLSAQAAGGLSFDEDERQILVRLMVTTDDAKIARIVKATNSQTSVPSASLRATEQVHIDIETYLKTRGLYYDRRKNYYRNQRKPRDRILGIGRLAQAVVAILLRRPDTARARPGTVINDEERYSRTFNTKVPLGLYYVCAKLVLDVAATLRRHESYRGFHNDILFYVLLDLVSRRAQRGMSWADGIASVDVESISEEDILASAERVARLYIELGGNDQVAKGRILIEKLNEALAAATSPAWNG